MSELLERVIAELKKRSVAEQDEIARLILSQLKNKTEKELKEKLMATEAVVWSPQADSAGIKALSELLVAEQSQASE